MTIGRKGFLALAGVSLASMATAAPTGLIVVPIADILAHRELSLTHGVTGFERKINKGYVHAGGATVGLYDRAEIGFATDYLGKQTWDAKLSVVDVTRGKVNMAASVGIANGYGKAVDPYVAARVGVDKARFHGGVWRLSNVVQGYVGLDYDVNDRLAFLIDHVGSRSGYTWAGLSYDVGAGLSVMGTIGRPNDRSAGVQHSFVLTYSIRF